MLLKKTILISLYKSYEITYQIKSSVETLPQIINLLILKT